MFNSKTSFKLIASVVLFIVAVIVSAAFLYFKVMRVGNEPFPTAPDSDLKSVLKALYLQQKFSDFAIENQGVNDAALYKNFGEFLNKHKPDDLDNATQQPGVIKSSSGAKP